MRPGLERRLARAGKAAVARYNAAHSWEDDRQVAFEARVKLTLAYHLAMIEAGLDPAVDDPAKLAVASDRRSDASCARPPYTSPGF